MLVPLHGFLHGDTLGLVVLVHDHQRVRELADSLQQAASCRVAPRARVRVIFGGRALDPEATIAECGLGALDRIDVIPEVDDGAP
jgi:hypothetical protein